MSNKPQARSSFGISGWVSFGWFVRARVRAVRVFFQISESEKSDCGPQELRKRSWWVSLNREHTLIRSHAMPDVRPTCPYCPLDGRLQCVSVAAVLRNGPLR